MLKKSRKKLTKKDFRLIGHALDITASDYDPDRNMGYGKSDPKPDAYKVAMQRAIDKLRSKLQEIEEGAR
jgi:hypothetical protein